MIVVRDLHFAYGNGQPVLRGVSFSIAKGEFVAVTGPSGSGKSTLFYLLGALAERFDGEMSLDGKSYGEFSPTEKAVFRNKKIGFVFQQFYLLPKATVLENVLLPTYYPYSTSAPTDADRDRAFELLERLGIREYADRTPQQLSGGQQQRVAIARALIRNPDVILADEPTGNLDSVSSSAVIDVFKSLHAEGKTIVLITHSSEIAQQCSRQLQFRDGQLVQVLDTNSSTPEVVSRASQMASSALQSLSYEHGTSAHWDWANFISSLSWRALLRAARPAWANIVRTQSKAALTALGVVLGIAAVLTTISLGSYARDRIISSYQVLGVNTATFWGWPNWRNPSREYSPAVFRYFSWQADILPMQKIFPEIELLSPVLDDYSGITFNFGGNSMNEDGNSYQAVNESYAAITNQVLAHGRNIGATDVDTANPVCVIGDDIKTKLFKWQDPIGQTLTIVSGNQSQEIPCRVIGVLAELPSQSDGVRVNSQVFLPYTYIIRTASTSWNRDIRELRMKIALPADPDKIGEQMKGYFKMRYGGSGQFSFYSNAKIIAQMKLFLTVFSSLLTAVAIIALMVGGVGINNMMLVNLSERLKELGLRKALGATPAQIRDLVLMESVLLCGMGGVVGIIFGFIGYEGLIFAATKLIPNMKFAWILNWPAIFFTVGAVVLTGILSGLVPAVKAERLEVIEAMRQD